MIRRVRLATGLVLFFYVTTHLLNHALGLISYAAMEDGRFWFLGLWRNPVGTIALYGSMMIHFMLALWALYDRRRLKFSIGEALQLSLGIAIPLLLALHIVGTRGAHEIAGTNDNYAFVLLIHFKFAPEVVFTQTAAVIAAWVHGCIGLFYWLRLKPWFSKWSQVLFSFALLIPVLSILGYIEGGREVLALFENKEWRDAARAAINFPSNEARAQIEFIAQMDRSIVVGSFILVLLARGVRALLARRRGIVHVTYPDGKAVSVAPGTTILEASKSNDIPHASVCGGRGRCSTCRVRIVDGEEALPAISDDEQKVLDRISAPPHVRLACQTRPIKDVTVMPLLPPTATPKDGHQRAAHHMGQEKEIVILFADLRDFTKFSEQKLPYDLVFVLNRYFANMGGAVGEAGGHLDKFIGDGVMALFGVDVPIAEGAKQAMKAAKLMTERLEELNQTLAGELAEPLRIGIGLHAGPAIIGEMGYGETTSLTAVGDAVNTASRIESMTKEYKAQLMLSQGVADHAGIDLSSFPSHQLDVRGRSEDITARVIVNAKDLPI
ncbi:MAG: 2Fe-2S iron-sulfur cluster binding domain-containing protein [Alphaproteobacteria bacterium]|nr:2Fe-2S iron-sulfur cluster binding domain-containing protein [Alphaproteobacteria bacterium]